MVVKEIPPFYVKRFENPEKCYIKCNIIISELLFKWFYNLIVHPNSEIVKIVSYTYPNVVSNLYDFLLGTKEDILNNVQTTLAFHIFIFIPHSYFLFVKKTYL